MCGQWGLEALCRGEVSVLAAGEGDGRSHAAGAAASTRSVPAGDAASAETILLVEDDAAVRALLARVLRRAGFAVLEAADGLDGLERWRAEGGAIGLVVTDVMMPRLPGPELVRQLRLERPGLRVLYVSGFTFGATLSDEAEFLAKPLQPAELVARVRGMLGPVAG